MIGIGEVHFHYTREGRIIRVYVSQLYCSSPWCERAVMRDILGVAK